MNTLNTDVLDGAIIFAVNAHKGTERKGKGFPYIVHPMETAAIVSTMTDDQELLAAAVLHDTVEDTAATLEELEEKFGVRVAALVAGESVELIPGKTEEESWHERRQIAIDRLKSGSRDAKIVALGDKLSNMRSIASDYGEIGDALWQRFHTNDPAEHAWHYRGLADALSELSDTAAYKEFVSLIEQVFPPEAELDMSQWTLTGEGHTAESFDHVDGKTMMKLYFDFVPDALIKNELRSAEAVYGMGLPTPKPGVMVRSGDRLGCTFERIVNKRSFARALSQEPERVEEFASRLVKMVKKLHSTPCDKSVFPSYIEKMRKLIPQTECLSEEERQKLLRLLDSTEDMDTCIHGDLHLGNVITDETADLFIDLADFAYGNPIFDLGALYLEAYVTPNAEMIKYFHIPRSLQRQVWLAFTREYFGAKTDEELAEVNKLVRRYSVFQALIFLNHNSSIYYYPPYLHEVLAEMGNT